MNLDQAVRILSRAVAAEVLRDRSEDKWEDHPLIGDFDFAEVEAAVGELSVELSPTTEEYEAAYAWFAARAEDEPC